MEPSNDLEVALVAATDRGDLELYLHLLRDATVVLPADPQTLGSGTEGWPSTMVDGMRHVPVFTSPEALLADPERRNVAYHELAMSELARIWPDPEWRLAVNPGFSTAVYLPGTYALSTGIRLGAVDPVGALLLPNIQMDGFEDIRTGTFEAGNQVEQELLQAIIDNDPEQALRALLGGTLFLVSTEEDGYTLPGQAGFRWLTIGMNDGDAVPVFTSRDRVDQGLRANTYTRLPITLSQLCEAWPGDDLALAVNPGTALSVKLPGAGVLGLNELAEQLGLEQGSSDFRPGAEPDQSQLDRAALALNLSYTPDATLDARDDVEHALLATAAAGDREMFLKVLFAMEGQLRLTAAREDDPGIVYAGGEFPWQTTVSGDRTVVRVFTSAQRQQEVTGGRGRSAAMLANLLRYWPDPAWDLAVNEGMPIGALLPGDQIATLSEWCDQYMAHRLAHDFPAPPATEKIDLQLLDAARRGDRHGFLEILRPSKVWVVSQDRELPSDTPPTGPAFPWRPVLVRGRPSMQVFTGTSWRTGSGKLLACRFSELVDAWPGDDLDLVLNPGTPISVTMTSDELRTFAANG